MDQSSPLSEAELQELVMQAQDGDTAAFERIYGHYFTQVFRYAAFRLPREAAEDTVSDIFVKAWEKLHTYKLYKNVPFGAWLFRIARHSVIDAYRSQRGFEEVPESLPDSDAFNHASARLERNETLHIVRQALQALPKRYREVLLLAYVSELPNGEVARVLRLSEGAVRILKMRALQKLKKELPPEFRNQMP